MTQPTFGTGSGGFAQPDLWQLLYGMTNINPALQMALQQYRSQSTLSGQLAQANASAQTGANAAMANVYGSQVAAQGGIAQQGIQSGTAASIANAQISADLIAAMGGDQNAAYRLEASLGLQAGIANQDMQRQILSALSTTGLRSQSQANAWMRGFQPQPGFGSAGNYWLNSVNPISAPQVQYSPYDLSGLMQASAPSANFTMPSMPTFNTGSFGGGNVGNIGGMFTDIYGQLQNTLGPMELLFGAGATGGGNPQTASDFTFGMTGDPTQSVQNTQAAWEALLAGQSTYAPGIVSSGQGSVIGFDASGNPIYGPDVPVSDVEAPNYGGRYLHAGGKIKPGETAIVGERGPEIAKGVKGGTDIIPLDKFRGGFDTGTGPHSHDGVPSTPPAGSIPPRPLPGEPGYVVPLPWSVNDPEFGDYPGKDSAPVKPIPLNPNLPAPLPGMGAPPDPRVVTGATPLNPPNGPVPGGYWQNGKFYPDPVEETTTYPTVDYSIGKKTQPLKAAADTPDYSLGDIDTAAEGYAYRLGDELSHVSNQQLLLRGFSRKEDGSIWYQSKSAGGRIPITQQMVDRLLQVYPAATTPDIGIPPGEEPVVEPPVEDGLEQPPDIDPRTGELPPDLSTLLSNFYEGFSYDPSQDLSGTGAEALGLPGIQALLGNAPQGFPGNQTFDLPELGMSGIRGPAQSASIFRPGILTPQEIDDISYLFQLGGYDPSTAAHIIKAFTPGKQSPFQALGF